jgi:hypothetical protein
MSSRCQCRSISDRARSHLWISSASELVANKLASRLGLRPPVVGGGDGRADALQVGRQGATADLVAHPAGIEAVGQGMVEAAEDHTAAGQGFQGRQTETLAHPTAAPVVGRVVKHHRGAVEQIHQILHPALLHVHPQTRGPQGGHQPVQHVVAVLAPLDQHIDGSPSTAPAAPGGAGSGVFCWIAGSGPPLQPLGIQGIGHQKQGIAGGAVSPVGQGVAAHRQHRHPGGQGEPVAAAVGVVGHRPSGQTTEQHGHIEPPADNPQSPTGGWFHPEQIVEEGVVRFPLPVGDQLGGDQAGGEAGGLQLHQQAATAKPAGGAWQQDSQRARRIRPQSPRCCRCAGGG